jgi:hypothetical protein
VAGYIFTNLGAGEENGAMEGSGFCDGKLNRVLPEPVFVDLLRRPGIDSQPGGPVRNPICRTGPPGYIGWRNRFLGIDSWAP